MTNTNTTYGIRPGVLYEARPGNLTPWGAHVNELDSYDQNYGQFVMVTVPADDDGDFAGQSWMIDTYHFDSSPSFPSDRSNDRNDYYIEVAAGREFVSSSALWRYKGDCYYNACVRLCEGNASLFKEVVDLRDVRFVTDDEACDYERDDIIEGIHLFREHGYNRWHYGDTGIIVRRKEAAKSPVRQALALAAKADMERPSWSARSYLFAMQRLAEFAWENRDDERVTRIFEECLPELEFAERVSEEHSRMCNEYYGMSKGSYGQMSLFDFDEDENVTTYDRRNG